MVETAQSRPPVVVGVDGSQAAIQAAQWALAEAADRGVPLRLVYVIDDRFADVDIKLQYAESALRAASRALPSTGSVHVETSIVHGPVDEVLAEESKSAAMLCVGSVGVGQVAWILLGSTAAGLAEKAHCPVAIIRRNGVPASSQSAPIAVAVDNTEETEPAVTMAMREAALRHASVLAVGVARSELGEMGTDELERRMRRWRTAHPGVPVHAVVAHRGFSDFLAHTEDPVQLAVIASDGRQAVGLVGPVAAGVVHHARCSVVVVPTRERADAKTDSSSSMAEAD